MRKAFQLKVTSAMFLHGASQSDEAELRPPAFKGEMRYWFRALAAAYYPPAKITELEAAIFGSADQKIGSKLLARITTLDEIERYKRDLLPHKNSGPSQAIKPDFQFTLELTARPGLEAKFFRAACWSLWVAVQLGGFGQRARRGAGSLLLLQDPGLEMPDDLPFEFRNKFDTLAALQKFLEQGLKAAHHCIRSLYTTTAGSGLAIPTIPITSNIKLPLYPVLAPGFARIQVAQVAGDDEEAVRSNLMFDLRGYKNPAFGLPYKGRPNGERHASPLHLHLTPLGPNEQSFALVQTLLYNRVTVNGASLPEKRPEDLPTARLHWPEMNRYLTDWQTKGAVVVKL